MKKSKIFAAALVLGGVTSVNAQLIDEKDVTVTMDLQPVLQLDMTTPNQVEFVFDEIDEYYSGITQYGATILKVSSTVSWDLYAVGRSTGTNGAEFWDQHIDYGNGASANAIPDLPLSLLELRQNQANNGDGAATGAFSDYSSPFPAVSAPSGANSLYVNAGTNTPPTLNDKYIGGHSGATGVVGDDFLPGGSYLTSSGTASDYYYSIDYRILPGLPAVFPMAFDADGTTAEDIVTVNGAGTYAEPGVYTMYVQYILLEDQ
ncbi:MAG: hypothetical protein H6600_06255 [Flavobacteriales bacterium]|nr:hypothetical protein [Flavobacteriales bacterium]